METPSTQTPQFRKTCLDEASVEPEEEPTSQVQSQSSGPPTSAPQDSTKPEGEFTDTYTPCRTSSAYILLQLRDVGRTAPVPNANFVLPGADAKMQSDTGNRLEAATRHTVVHDGEKAVGVSEA
ncbi:unnamed protein product, partial [Choristocarpus tenellus]